MAQQVTFRITDREAEQLAEVVRQGRYPNRTAALRAGLTRTISDERERVIDEQYRRGYGEHPQEEWVGQAGQELGDRLVSGEKSAGKHGT